MFAIIDTGTSVPCSEAMRRSRGEAKLAAAESRFLYLRAFKKKTKWKLGYHATANHSKKKRNQKKEKEKRNLRFDCEIMTPWILELFQPIYGKCPAGRALWQDRRMMYGWVKSVKGLGGNKVPVSSCRHH